MDESNLRNGFAELERLSSAEYHEDLAQVLADANQDAAISRIARLGGVILKQPFAKEINRSAPSGFSRAYRAWELVDEMTFRSPQATKTWQYKALEQILSECALDDPHLLGMSTYQLAVDAHYERGFFGYFARSLTKYICGDPKIRKEVENALKAAGRGGTALPAVTPQYIVGSGGLGLGAFLVHAVPIMGYVGAPVVAAVVVILYTLGINAYCEWSRTFGASGIETAP